MEIVHRIKNAGDSGEIVREEEADFSYDLRLARRWNRRRIVYESLKVKSCSNKRLKKTMYQDNKKDDAMVIVDLDSERSLNDLEMFVDFDAGVDKISDVLDPQYTMFLNNLKEDGKSYVLELALDNERSAIVKYEKEDGFNNGLQLENLETTKCCRNEKNVRTVNILRNHSEREKIENPRRTLRSNLGREKTENPKRVLRTNLGKIKCERLKRVPRTRMGRKKVLRSSARQKIESLRVTFSSNSGTEKTESPQKTLRSNSNRKDIESRSIMHEVKREKTKTLKTLRGNSRREKNESPSIMPDVVKTEKSESRRTLRSNSRRENNESLSTLHCVLKGEKSENAITLRNVLRELVVEKNVTVEAEDPVSSAENGCSSKRHSPKATTNYKCNHGLKLDLVDESCLEFWKFVKYGQHMVYAPKGIKEVVYEESESDSEVVVVENDPFSDGNYTPCVDVDGERCVEILTGGKESHFREELMEFLQKPYDRLEYKKLSLEASFRRPLEDDRDFCGRTRSCGLDSDGKSYLDEFSDLATLIDQAHHDRRRILNLLRGFFYWLKNLVHEGAFKPWLDSSCLSILPPV